MRKKAAESGPTKRVSYSDEHWMRLDALRNRARDIVGRLGSCNIESVLFGSISRGDITQDSDIDIFITCRIPSFKIELCIGEEELLERVITQATPMSLIKGNLYLTGNINISFPLLEPLDSELEFYFFAGAINYEQLAKGVRTQGVDKRLMLIIPEEQGHLETPVSDLSSGVVAKRLGVGQRIVDERIRVLQRRRKIGTTGLYVERRLLQSESFESVLNKLISTDSAIRRRAEWHDTR